MKKLLLTACCFILIGFQSRAQLDTIPNAGFENWNFTPMWTIEATGWQSNNSSIAAWNVMPDSVSHSGLLGLKLEKISYRGTIWSGFPVSQHPLTLEGFVKNGLNIGDTALVFVWVYSSNTIVDTASYEIYGGIGSGYLPFSVNISQNASSADSCLIILTGGNMFSSTISFDDLSFTFPTSVNENFADDGLRIFPNPATEELKIENAELKIESIQVCDVSGKKLFSQISNLKSQILINVSHLSPGTYVLSITSDKKISNRLIIKN